MNNFWGMCSLSRSRREKQQFDLSPFFLNKRLKKTVIRDDFFTFECLVENKKNNPLSVSQPYWNIDKTVCIVADARIDNRDELIAQLYREGSLCEIISNEELILTAYAEWGAEFPKKIVGDFSAALWDSSEKQLVCVRDRVGLKTLYYHTNSEFFVFASEISPLLHSPDYVVNPNINSMTQFLHFPTELEYNETMYDGINSLPPAHILIFKEAKITMQRYWFPEKIKIDNSITFDLAVKKFHELFEKAVESRLDSSSETGIELSGGLDSSSVTAVANKDGASIVSFSMVYDKYECDETKYIQSMVYKTGVENIICSGHNIDFKSKYNLDFIYQLNPVWPNFVNSAVKMPLVEKIEERNINVVLTGIGGDETLSGSMSALTDYYKSSQWHDLWSELKYHRFNIKIIYRYLFIAFLNNKQKSAIKSVLNFFQIGSYQISKNKDEGVDISKCMSLEQSDHIRAISNKYFSFWANANFSNALRQYNIEYRHPFYDTRLIEFLLSLPPGFRYRKGVVKRLLREAMKDLLSAEVYSRDDKAEFSEIVYDQIQAVDLETFWKNKYIVALGIVSENEIEKAVKRFRNLTLKNDYSVITPLWRLINLEKWYRVNFIDN